jgi:hypothetical protein
VDAWHQRLFTRIREHDMSDRIAFFLAAATTVASLVAALMLPMLDEHTHLAQIAASADVSAWLDPHNEALKPDRERSGAQHDGRAVRAGAN